MGIRLWDGGSRKFKGEQLQYLLSSQILFKKQIWSNILGKYAVYYWDLTAISTQVELAEKQVFTNQQLQNRIILLVKEGQLPELSLSLAKSNTYAAEAKLAQKQAELSVQKHSFALWLSIELKDLQSLPAPPEYEFKEIDIKDDSFVEQSSKKYVAAMDIKSQSLPSWYKPNIDAYALIQSHQLEEENWSAGISLGWKIWDGKDKKYQRAKIKSEQDVAQWQLLKVQREMTIQRQSIVSMQNAILIRERAIVQALKMANKALGNQHTLLNEGQLDNSLIFTTQNKISELEMYLVQLNTQKKVLVWQYLSINGNDLQPLLTGVRK